ncbi:MAG TPA: hypothetical protein VFJ71_01225 [Candidatus Limnocylindrales bacterium]|nr:hypothetical protein [Candidatus Limnocylindrales bacterium]
MFSTSHLYVAATLDEKRAAAAAERLASSPSATSQLKTRVDAVVKSAWSLLSGPAERPVTPTLVNYPFRG